MVGSLREGGGQWFGHAVVLNIGSRDAANPPTAGPLREGADLGCGHAGFSSPSHVLVWACRFVFVRLLARLI